MTTRTRRNRGIAVASVALLALGAASCSSSSTSSSSDTTGPSAESLLGTPNKATGTPIKIGLVSDGKTDAIDNTQSVAASKAVFDYANDYLGGINGHPIEVVTCETKQTPSGATSCGVQMLNDKVAAVLVGASGQDTAVYTALDGEIPYFTSTTASGGILGGAGAYVLTSPLSSIGAGVPIAQDAGVSKAGFIVIDVPAATGPITAIATPVYQDGNVELSMIPVSPEVADMTPQVQAGISQGLGQFSITGTAQFVATAIKALKQAAFDGPIIAGVSNPDPALAESIPGGYEGVTNISSATEDPADPDVQLMNAIIEKYAPGNNMDISGTNGYLVAMGFVLALEGATAAVDAPTVMTALSSMPSPVKQPLGAGITFQCGSKPVALTPNACTSQVLKSTLDAAGKGSDFQVVSPPS